MRTDWTPLDVDFPVPLQTVLRGASDIDHAAAIGSRHNGLPEPVPYQWNAAGKAREAQVAAELAVIRAEVRRRRVPADGG